LEISIRHASAADAAVIADLIGEMARAFGGEREMDESYVPVFLSHPGTAILLAEAGGDAVGLLACGIKPNLYHGGSAGIVEELVVRPAYRRRGVGEALLRHALDLLEDAGCVEVALSTDLGNQGAQALYRRVGLADESLELSRHRRQRADTDVCRPPSHPAVTDGREAGAG
jgi:ribosomal protein S18 acetylase RimI-like enzyme